MSWAGVTVAVLPDALAQAAAAVCTACVSASPEDPMRICRFAGPVCCCWSSLKPLPHAVVASTTAIARTATGLRWDGLAMSVPPQGITFGWDGHPLPDDQTRCQQHVPGRAGQPSGVELGRELTDALGGRLAEWLPDTG